MNLKNKLISAALSIIGLGAIGLLILVGMVVSGHAAEKPPLTVAQALSLLSALRNLDGHLVIIKQAGADQTVMVPWDFGSGTLRLRISRNITALAVNEKAVEDARQGIVREVIKSAPGAKEITQNTPEWENFARQFNDVLNAAATVDLSRIRASELKLDKNEIPVTALSALAPILDDDVTPK